MIQETAKNESASPSLAIFLTGVSLFLAASFYSVSKAQSLPEIDPAREWLGRPYADVVIAEFRRTHPEIKLVIDEKDLLYFKNQNQTEPWNVKQAAKDFLKTVREDKSQKSLKEKIVSAGREAFTPPVNNLLSSLENGSHIYVVDNDREGSQNRLREWILSRPDGSVAPHEIMREALVIMNGRVVAAWALAWNVMSENWESAATRNYSRLHRKLISLTGERNVWNGAAHYVVLPEKERHIVKSTIFDDGVKREAEVEKRLKLDITKRGDEFSYFYHRLGVELLAIVIAKVTDSPLMGWSLAKAGALGEYLKYTNTAGLAKEALKRVGNDLKAADSGARIYRLITENKNPLAKVERLGAELYLQSRPGKFNLDYQILDGRPAAYFGVNIDKKFWAPSMTEEELLFRFYHATKVDSEIFDIILMTSNGETERLHRGLADYIDSGAKNEVLNSMIREWVNNIDARPEQVDVKVDLDLSEWSNERYAKQVSESFDYEEAAERIRRQMERVLGTVETNKRVQRRLKQCIDLYAHGS